MKDRADVIEGMARIKHHDHRLADEGKGRAVLPVDAGRLDALAPLVGVIELAQDPGCLAFERRVDLVQTSSSA